MLYHFDLIIYLKETSTNHKTKMILVDELIRYK